MILQSRITAILMMTLTLSPLAVAKSKIFKNEKHIEFSSNQGEVTDAFEGHLFVKENRNNPDSRTIRINYVRFPATGDKKGSPIVYLSGGPGGSGIATAKWKRYPLFQALREYGDVIALDQRGTGASEKADECLSSEVINHDEKQQKHIVEEQFRKAAKECLTHWQQQGIDIYGYTTEQIALDLNDLRKHLKAEKINLWGISYGSHLAMSAIKLFPSHIEKVMIASAEGLNQTVKLPSQTDNYFLELQKVIDQQPLKARVPDLFGLIQQVHSKLDKTPIPITLSTRDGSQESILLQSQHLKMLASRMISDPNQGLALLIQTYLSVDNGDTGLVSNILSRGLRKNQPISFQLMPLAVDIASGITSDRLNIVNKQASTALLGDMLNFPMPLLNNIDPKLDLGDKFREKPHSTIPTLLFTGTLDGRTYPEEQLDAVSGLTNLTHIKVINAGHNLYTTSSKVLEMMERFLAGKSLDTDQITLPIPNLQMRRN